MKIDWKKAALWSGIAVAGALGLVVILSAIISKSNLQHRQLDR